MRKSQKQLHVIELYTPKVQFRNIMFGLMLGAPVLVGLLIRFGALTIITASFVINTLWFPMTTDLSAWYAGSGLLALGTVVVLAGYGFHSSRGGQSLFGKGWLGED